MLWRIKEKHPEFGDFQWQSGYGVFSLAHDQVDAVRSYIENQSEHHRTESFQEEFLRLLTMFGVEFDERYMWD